MKKPLLLNADLGEGCEDDPAIMSLIDFASIACGGHAGDSQSMDQSIALAIKNDVRIGAHPSYADARNFGRLSQLQEKSIGKIVDESIDQIIALQAACIARGVTLSYIKPHGALYHDLNSNDALSQRFVYDCIEKIGGVFLMGPNRGSLFEAALKRGCGYMIEAYADRRYNDNGELIARSEEHRHPVLQSTEEVLNQVQSISRGHVLSDNGQIVPIDAESICVHGDTPGALKLAQAIREAIGP